MQFLIHNFPKFEFINFIKILDKNLFIFIYHHEFSKGPSAIPEPRNWAVTRVQSFECVGKRFVPFIRLLDYVGKHQNVGPDFSDFLNYFDFFKKKDKVDPVEIEAGNYLWSDPHHIRCEFQADIAMVKAKEGMVSFEAQNTLERYWKLCAEDPEGFERHRILMNQIKEEILDCGFENPLNVYRREGFGKDIVKVVQQHLKETYDLFNDRFSALSKNRFGFDENDNIRRDYLLLQAQLIFPSLLNYHARRFILEVISELTRTLDILCKEMPFNSNQYALTCMDGSFSKERVDTIKKIRDQIDRLRALLSCETSYENRVVKFYQRDLTKNAFRTCDLDVGNEKMDPRVKAIVHKMKLQVEIRLRLFSQR